MDIQRTHVIRLAVLGSLAILVALAILTMDETMTMVVLSSLGQALALVAAIEAVMVVQKWTSR